MHKFIPLPPHGHRQDIFIGIRKWEFGILPPSVLSHYLVNWK